MAYGLAQDILITLPNWILFADKVGCNTSQMDDGHAGGEKLLVAWGDVPQQQASGKDHHFTMLPITSASGDAEKSE